MRIKKGHNLIGAILFLSFLLILGGCSETASEDNNDLIVATTGEANSLDPHNTTDSISKNIYSIVAETLVMLDKDGEVEPLLAKSWDHSEDGKVWTFQLQEDVEFHDGTPFNAEAVRISFERVTNEENKLARYPLLGPYLDKITTNGDYEVSFHLKTPVGPFLNILAFPSGGNIISPKSIEEGEDSIKTKPIGTGPYKIKQWSPGTDTVLEAHTNYWGGEPKLDTITLKSVPENASRVIMLETGEADIISDVPASDIERLNDSDGLKVESLPLNRTLYVGINTEFEPFQDVAVRQALNLAVDKEALANDLYEGRVTPSTAAVSEKAKMYHNVGSYSYDLEKAKELLKSAGIEEGVKVRMIAAGNATRDHKAGEYVQDSLRNLGFDVELQMLELNDYLTTLEDPSKYDLFLRGGIAQTNDANDLMQDALLSTSEFNYAKYSNDRVDELILSGATETDESNREALYAEALGIIKEEAPLIFLYEDVVHTGMRENVKGLMIPPNNTMNFSEVSK